MIFVFCVYRYERVSVSVCRRSDVRVHMFASKEKNISPNEHAFALYAHGLAISSFVTCIAIFAVAQEIIWVHTQTVQVPVYNTHTLYLCGELLLCCICVFDD